MKSQQPCWTCRNAVPSADGRHGCEWSEELRPVPGWDAELITKPGLGILWAIRSCPKYSQDPPRQMVGS